MNTPINRKYYIYLYILYVHNYVRKYVILYNIMALLFIYRLTSGGFPAGRAIALRVSINRNIIYTRRVTFNIWYRCRLVVHINIL